MGEPPFPMCNQSSHCLDKKILPQKCSTQLDSCLCVFFGDVLLQSKITIQGIQALLQTFPNSSIRNQENQAFFSDCQEIWSSRSHGRLSPGGILPGGCDGGETTTNTRVLKRKIFSPHKTQRFENLPKRESNERVRKCQSGLQRVRVGTERNLHVNLWIPRYSREYFPTFPLELCPIFTWWR